MSRFTLLLFILFLSPVSSKASTEPSSSLPASLDPENPTMKNWLRLMLYHPTGSGYKSKIRSPEFFMTTSGETDAEHELQFEVETFKKVLPLSENHPQCLFPARYRILQQGFPLAAPVNCALYKHWYDTYPLSYVSVIYVSQYLSNPISVFGHSFLLLGSDKLEEYTQSTFNYGADIPEDVNVLAYAVKGLAGQFPGTFTMNPFYQSLHSYSDMEDREMWEYRLDLTPEDLKTLSAYLWETKNRARLDYYFFDENCATILLWLLQLEKPQADFSPNHPIYFMPSEITKVIARNHLASQVIFHPSLMEKLLAKTRLMNEDEKKSFLQDMKQNHVTAPAPDSLVLDALVDHLNIVRHRSMGVLNPELKSFEREVLLARAKTPAEDHFTYPSAFDPKPPHEALGSMRLQAGGGDENGSTAQIISIRPGVHGLLDREAGFLRDSEIDIMNLELQHANSGSLYMESLTVMKMTNLRPINIYQNPISFSGHLIYQRNDFWQDPENRYFEAGGDIGYAHDFGSPQFLGFAMLEVAGRTTAPPLSRFELGPELGMVLSWGPWKALSKVGYLVDLDSNEDRHWMAWDDEVRFEFSSQWSGFLNFEQMAQLGGPNLERKFEVLAGYYF